MVMKSLGVVLITASALLLTGCGGVRPDVEESSDFIDIGGIKFRKKGSTNTDMLYAGMTLLQS